ncbi:hypothetical protein BC834DRAFT_969695 [Gloeopeniophorella convolvens]|nr:hypothetical protein BC834DRAFT_969695 [Gloeopeniophorella convolvens]
MSPAFRLRHAQGLLGPVPVPQQHHLGQAPPHRRRLPCRRPLFAQPRAGLPRPVHVSFAGWVPPLHALLGMLVVGLIDNDRVRDDAGFGGARAVWRAQLIPFVGFAFMAGGLAGSVALLVSKFVTPGYRQQNQLYGYAKVAATSRSCFPS